LVGTYLPAAPSGILKKPMVTRGHANVVVMILRIAFARNVLLVVRQVIRIVTKIMMGMVFGITENS
jgi:hypothetical protein